MNLKFLKFKVTLMADLLSVGPGCRPRYVKKGGWTFPALQGCRDHQGETGNFNWHVGPRITGPTCGWPKFVSGYDSRSNSISFFQGRPHCSARKRFCILLRARRNLHTASWLAYTFELSFPCCRSRWGPAGSSSLTGSHCFLLIWANSTERFALGWLLYLAQPQWKYDSGCQIALSPWNKKINKSFICMIVKVRHISIHYVRWAGAGGWCWSGVREKYCWLAGGWCWSYVRGKYCWQAGGTKQRTEWLSVWISAYS